MKFSLKNNKNAIIMLLKVFFAIAIIYWLVSQDKLDFRLVILSFHNPVLWVACFLIFILQIFLSAIRWKIILNAKISNIPIQEIFRIQWIGQVFSVILPGVITGDIIKIGYINSLKKNSSKKFLVLSIFIDRLVGLNSLLLIAGISSLFYFQELTELNLALKNVIYLNILFLIGSFAILALFFLNPKIQSLIKNSIPSKKINEILETIWVFSQYKKAIFSALALSTLMNVMMISSFWIINLPFFEKAISPKYILSLTPIGFVSTSIPVSPAGLGVGHAAFGALFQLIGQSNGASLFNVYWVVMVVANLCGFIPFILTKNLPVIK